MTVYSKTGGEPTKVITTGQLNFTTNAAPIADTKDVEGIVTLSSVIVPLKLGGEAPVDPLLEESANAAEEETETATSSEEAGTEATGNNNNNEGEEEEITIEISGDFTGSLTLNKVSYELNFDGLQAGAVVSLSQNLKFIIVNKNQFLVVATQVAEDGTVTEQVLSAERAQPPPQVGFLQKYSSTLMLVGVMLFSNFFKKQNPAPAPAAAAAAQ